MHVSLTPKTRGNIPIIYIAQMKHAFEKLFPWGAANRRARIRVVTTAALHARIAPQEPNQLGGGIHHKALHSQANSMV
jgi:hypothetical protein